MALKIFISVDMEGISGVVHRDHTGRNGKDYDLACRLMTLEANAAIEGAFDAGADEVVVSDSHGTFRNLIPDLLDPRALLITGTPVPLGMMSGIDDSFGAASCVGYHNRAGTLGILDHTISSAAVYDYRINGQSQSELGINVGIAAQFGVPIVLVTGDSETSAMARELIPGVETASVKEALARHAARGLSPQRARELVRERATRAVERRAEISTVSHDVPVTIEVQFMYSSMAQLATLIPGVESPDPLTASYTSSDYIEAVNCMRAAIVLAGTV